MGYSQGAGVMHAAAGDLPEELYPKIKSLVMFGDPMVRLGERGEFPEGLKNRVMQNCAEGDPVSSSDSITPWRFPLLRGGGLGVQGGRGFLTA